MASVRFEDLPPELQAKVADRIGETGERPTLPEVTKASLAWEHKSKRKPRATRSRKQPTRKPYFEGPVVHRGPRPKPEFELYGEHIMFIVVIVLFALSSVWW